MRSRAPLQMQESSGEALLFCITSKNQEGGARATAPAP